MSLLIEDDYPEPVDPQQAATRQPGWLGRRPWPAAARQLLIADHEPRRGAPDAHYPPPGQSRYENPYGNPYPAGAAGDLRYPGEVLDDDASGDLDEDLDQDPDEGEAGDEDPYYPEPAG